MNFEQAITFQEWNFGVLIGSTVKVVSQYTTAVKKRDKFYSLLEVEKKIK